MDQANDLNSVMKRIDDFLYDPAKLPYRGWHEDQSTPGGPPPTAATYKPAIQQVRSEFEEFLSHVLAAGLRGTAIQIGLGISGGSHFALRQIFDRVISIDVNAENIARFKSSTKLDPDRDIIIHASSIDTRVVNHLHQVAGGCDLIFIDGGHLFVDVRADWAHYRNIVRPGGFVCFHDHVPRPARYHELQIDIFLAWLENQPTWDKPIVRVGNTLGIAYYVA